MSDERLELAMAGSWTTAEAGALEALASSVPPPGAGRSRLRIDVAGLAELDTLGAMLIERLLLDYDKRGAGSELVGLPDRYQRLFGEVSQSHRRPENATPAAVRAPLFPDIGEVAASVVMGSLAFIDMLGRLGSALLVVISRPARFRWIPAIHHLDRVGWRAVPIILLITFLIGAIIAQQGIFHFRQFGAEDYVVDLVGILVLRELGVLIVAIMVAGRSGSSYTAELGSMKMREEIDALRVLGLDPVEVLMLPRVIALVCALPILTLIGSLSAMAGGGLVAWLYGGMSPEVFIARLKDAVTMTHFQVGMIKAPFMALIVGVVACTEGMRVQGSTESLGLQTTASVVKAIFLVIVLDGLFAIFFSSIGM